MSEHRSYISGLRRRIALLGAAVVLVGCGVVVASTNAPTPFSFVSRFTPKPIVGVTLGWTKGSQPATLFNITSGEYIYAGLADAVMFSARLGATNQFVAFNDGGSTPVVSAVATNQDLRCTIAIHSFLVTVPVRSNTLTWVMTSTNLATWYRIATVMTTNTSHQFVWTNDGSARYFRSVRP